MDNGENLKLLLEELSKVYKRKTPKYMQFPLKSGMSPLKYKGKGKRVAVFLKSIIAISV